MNEGNIRWQAGNHQIEWAGERCARGIGDGDLLGDGMRTWTMNKTMVGEAYSRSSDVIGQLEHRSVSEVIAVGIGASI